MDGLVPFHAPVGVGGFNMDFANLKKCRDWFGVKEFKSLEDPTGRVARKELIVSLDQYPHDFSLGPNPREPQMNNKVSRGIAETLEEDHENFHLLNRGVIVMAKGAQYDNRSQRVRLSLHETEEEERYFGILDGGNTNKRINVWRSNLSEEDEKSLLPKTFVNVTVLIPTLSSEGVPSTTIENLVADITEARNTSVQVKSKSLADARRHFDRLKDVLKNEPYFDRISWKEGDKGTIDALDIISLLMIFYPQFCKDTEGGEPYGVYGHKSRCLDAYLDYAKKEPEELEIWIEIVPSLVRLFDELQSTFPYKYPGRFGTISEVRIYDEAKHESGSKKYRKTPFWSKFLGCEMKYSSPAAFVYPIFAAFRVLAGSGDSGHVTWKQDPIKFWERHGKRISDQFWPHMKVLDFIPKKVATSLICYQATRHAVNDCYKDELLKAAGIQV